MAGDPRIRASDDDRERTVSLLREHHAAGRLTLDEFNERLDKAYAAKTLGELDELMSDLPAIDLYRLPDASLPPHYRRQIPGSGSLQAAAAGSGMARGHGRFSPAWQAAWGSWFTRHRALLRGLGAERRRVPVAAVDGRAVGRGHARPLGRAATTRRPGTRRPGANQLRGGPDQISGGDHDPDRRPATADSGP